MANFDILSTAKPEQGFAPVTVTDNTATETGEIDMQGYEGLMFIINIGTLADADATFTVAVTESDTSGGSFTAVADAFLIETEADASFTFDDDDTTREIGYVGKKRYVKLSVTPANNTGNATYGCVAIKGRPLRSPTTVND